MRTLWPALLLPLLLGGCEDDDVTGVVTNDPSRPLEELMAAPGTVEIEATTVTASAYVWRDFMPGNDDSSMIASLRLTIDGPAPLEDVIPERIWVIRDGLAWEATVSERFVDEQDGIVRGTIRRGPKWPTGSRVALAAQVRIGDSSALVGLADLEIMRTE